MSEYRSYPVTWVDDLVVENERISAEDFSIFEAGYSMGRKDAEYDYPPRPRGAFNEWRKVKSNAS